MIAFEVPGEPVPYARSGAKGGMRFTPPKQRHFMTLVKMVAGKHMAGRAPMAGPLRLALRATYVVPASWSKKARAAATWKISKPDGSNLLKIVEDALNGVVWGDDAQVARLEVEKVYGPAFGLYVEVSELEPAPGLLTQAAA